MISRLAWCAVLVALAGIGPAASLAAPALLPPTGGVRIESLTHNARGALRAGDVLTVTLRGSARATATFGVLNMLSGATMREARPGVYGAQPSEYTGRYTVRSGDVTRNAALVADLRLDGQDVLGLSDRPVTVDTRAPRIVSRRPMPGVRIANVRPNIAVTFDDLESGVDPAAVRMIINGKDVSSRTTITETFAAYTPETPFASGNVDVRVTVVDRAGNTSGARWAFLVAPPSALISSVTVNPALSVPAGGILTVVMTGASGGEAAFTVEGIPEAVPMRESSTSGLYFGSYMPRPGQNVTSAALLVTLVRDGRKSATAATTGVTILTTPPRAPRILSLRGKDGDGGGLVMRGSARADYRVLARLSYESALPSGQTSGALGEFLTRAASDGSWQIAVDPLIRLRGAKLTFSVVAIDPVGQRSPPAVYEVNP